MTGLIPTTDEEISPTPCGVAFGKTKLAGRYVRFRGNVTLECFSCEFYISKPGKYLTSKLKHQFIDHLKSEHPEV